MMIENYERKSCHPSLDTAYAVSVLCCLVLRQKQICRISLKKTAFKLQMWKSAMDMGIWDLL